MTEMIKKELISEEILGDRLKREQLNFLYDLMVIIYNSPARPKMFEKSMLKNKMISLSIPQLTALKTIQRMDLVYSKKIIEKKEQEMFHRSRRMFRLS